MLRLLNKRNASIKKCCYQTFPEILKTLNNLLDIARKTFPQKLSDLRQAIEQNDDKEIKSLLHSLKGSAQNMRFDGLGKLAADFEASLGGLDIDVRTKRFREMVEEWDEVRRIIT